MKNEEISTETSHNLWNSPDNTVKLAEEKFKSIIAKQLQAANFQDHPNSEKPEPDKPGEAD